ncbi:matrixin family metalloprotease [Macrococcus epidermidis]|uniref:matrixin family metalloprotease n=1 Tax=Macrococcus epidermidis TaxID=1902580 RepID=UPI0020B698A4|nr:matrixin family metalloprotease [Macrococcus epidermidis]UTH16248.1 matrixin family metalloprotease [Macrococcus epidermidis]
MKKRLKVGIAICILGVSGPLVAEAVSIKLNTWDLVDGGKHMDYDGNSKYMSRVKYGAGVWNDYKSGVIRADSASVLQDVYCSDTSKNNSVNATTYATGKIIFNKYNMDKASEKEQKNVAIHELGHGLRLDHNQSGDIMYKYSSSDITLSANDKASYTAAYKKY